MKTKQTIRKKVAKLPSSLFLVILTGFFSVGCSDSDLAGETLPSGGEGEHAYVKFSASVRESRLAYGDIMTDGGNHHSPIYWEPADKVLIFSPANVRNQPVYGTDEDGKEDKNVIIKDANDQAGGYAVTTKTGETLPNNNSTTTWFSYLEDGSDHLEWKVNPGETQNFHAFFPYDHVGVSNETVSGRVPEVQDVTIPKNLLYARLSDVERKKGIHEQEIGFEFEPILNRLEITIKNPDRLPIQAVRITSGRHRSRAQAVAGDLVARMTNSFNPAKDIVFDATSDRVYRVFSPDEATQSQVTVGISLLPQVYDSLNITVQVNANGVTRSVTRLAAKMPNQYGRATRQLVNFGSFIEGDLELEADNSRWMANVSDDALISQLSIPGAAMAGTESKKNDARDRHQIEGIGGLLLNGVRALEFRCEDGSGNEKAILELYGLRERGGNATGVHTKIQDVVRYLNGFPTETVIVLAMYSNLGYWVGDTRHASERTRFVNKMRYILNTYAAGKVITYKPGLTLGDCRGKILFLSPDEVFAGKEMGWDYYDRNSSATYRLTDSECPGKEGGLKDLKMLCAATHANGSVSSPRSGQGDVGEDLWLQLYRCLLDNSKKQVKFQSIKDFLKDAATKPAGTWVINYATAYRNYNGTTYSTAQFAEDYYQFIANYINDSVEPDSDEDTGLKRPQGPTGIVFMDYAGTKTHKFSDNPDATVTLNGDKLLKAVINANWDYEF